MNADETLAVLRGVIERNDELLPALDVITPIAIIMGDDSEFKKVIASSKEWKAITQRFAPRMVVTASKEDEETIKTWQGKRELYRKQADEMRGKK